MWSCASDAASDATPRNGDCMAADADHDASFNGASQADGARWTMSATFNAVAGPTPAAAAILAAA